MKKYSQSNYYFYRTDISLEEYDTVIMEQRTLLSYCKETFPLVAFSPEQKLVQGRLGGFAKMLLLVEFLAITSFTVAIFTVPLLMQVISLSAWLMVAGMFMSISWFYYRTCKKDRLYFYFYNDEPAFVLNFIKHQVSQSQWIGFFNASIRKARINYYEMNLLKIKNGIDHLQKQGIISKQFALELHARVESLADSQVR